MIWNALADLLLGVCDASARCSVAVAVTDLVQVLRCSHKMSIRRILWNDDRITRAATWTARGRLCHVVHLAAKLAIAVK